MAAIHDNCPHGISDIYECRDCGRAIARPGEYEWFQGRYRKVLNGDRLGWWRFNDHYDRDGYCDNPARGY